MGVEPPNVEVLIAFRSLDEKGTSYRRQALGRVLRLYRSVFDGRIMPRLLIDNRARRFPKAALLNQAALGSTAEILVFQDADTLVMPRRIEDAVYAAQLPLGPVFAFDLYLNLTRPVTDALASWRNAFFLPEEAYELVTPNAGSHGCYAIRRESFLECGGYDERFTGWGFEDLALNVIYAQRYELRRIPGPAVHLWHPRARENPANEKLWDEYKRLFSVDDGGALAKFREGHCLSPSRT